MENEKIRTRQYTIRAKISSALIGFDTMESIKAMASLITEWTDDYIYKKQDNLGNKK